MSASKETSIRNSVYLLLAAASLVVAACDGSGRSYRSPTAPPTPTVPNLARLWTGSTIIESVDELLDRCATPLVAPGARESVTVHINQTYNGNYLGIASGTRFSPELGLQFRIEGQTITAASIPAVFYYEDAPHFDCRNGHPVERVWVYGARFAGVVAEDRIEGTLEVFYRTGPHSSDPGTIVSSHERLELVRADT